MYSRIREIYENGGVLAGTSAGASAMSETMLVTGNGDESYRIKSALLMAPGLSFAPDLLIDQHFSQRGRMARLIGAVTQNPRVLGIGIDEDTAIIVDREAEFHVLGKGAVYVVDGSSSTYSNIGEEESERTLSSFSITLHMLSQGDEFDLNTRTPRSHPAKTLDRSKREDEEPRETARVASE
jgi:cyanophycinase